VQDLIYHVDNHFSRYLFNHRHRQFSQFRFLSLDHVVQRSVQILVFLKQVLDLYRVVFKVHFDVDTVELQILDFLLHYRLAVQRGFDRGVGRIYVHRARALDRQVEHHYVYIVLSLYSKFRESDINEKFFLFYVRLKAVRYELGRMVDDQIARERLVLVVFLRVAAEERITESSEHFQIDLLDDERL